MSEKTINSLNAMDENEPDEPDAFDVMDQHVALLDQRLEITEKECADLRADLAATAADAKTVSAALERIGHLVAIADDGAKFQVTTALAIARARGWV